MFKLLLTLLLVATASAALQPQLTKPKCESKEIGHESAYPKTVSGYIPDGQCSGELDVNYSHVLCPQDGVEGALATACDHDYAPLVSFYESNPRIVDVYRQGDCKGQATVTVTVYCTYPDPSSYLLPPYDD